MTTTYQRVAFNGVVVAVNRLVDGLFAESFGVPPSGASQAVIDQYRQNDHFRRYEADVAAGAQVLDPEPDPILPPLPDFGGDADDDPTFRTKAPAAVDNLRAYLATANGSVTPLQTVQALKLLIRVVLFLVRRSL